MRIERTKNASRNITVGIILKIYQITMPFLIRTVMIYYMGVQYVGLSSLFTSILQVLNLAELGVGSAMVYSMYEPIANDDHSTICALMKLYKTYYRIIGALIAIVGIILTPFIPYFIKSNLPSDLNIYALYLLNLVATVLSYWLFAYKNCLFQAHQRLDIISKVTLVTSAVQYAFQFIVILMAKDYYYYLIVALAVQALTNIMSAVVANKVYPNYQPKGTLNILQVKEINRRVKDLFTAKFGSVIVGSADTIVISAFLGLNLLAIYQNYYFILNSVCGLIAIIFSSVLGGMGNSFIVESREKNYLDFKNFTFIINWILCVCCSCFVGLYQPFMEIWVGQELMLSFDYVILFCVYFYINEMIVIWATVKDAAGMWHEDRFRPLISASTNLVLNLILVQYIGLYGILLSTIVTYAFIAMPWLIRNLFSILYKRSSREYLTSVCLYAVITVFTCVFTTIICNFVKLDGALGLIIRAFICITIPNIIQLVSFGKRQEFLFAKSLVLRIISKKTK